MSAPRWCESFKAFHVGGLGEAAPSMRNQPLEFFGKRKKERPNPMMKAEKETTTVKVRVIPESAGRRKFEAK